MVKLTKFNRERLHQLLKGAEINPDTFDSEAYWDSALTYHENIANISQALNLQLLSQAEKDRTTRAITEAQEIQSRQDFESNIRKAESEAIQKISSGTTTVLEDYYSNLKSLVRMVAKGHTNNLFVVGEGAVGKSHTILSTLASENLKAGDDFVYFSGYLTPLELYHHLFDNQQKLVIFDDTEGLEDIKSISILKSAMWGTSGERVVSYKSTSKELKAPSQFIFQGRIILCSNRLPNGKNKESMDALVSRAFMTELKFNFADKMRILAEIASVVNYKTLTLEQRQEVFKFIQENSDETTEGMNIRLLLKAFDAFVSGEDWKMIAKGMLNSDGRLSLMKQLLSKPLSVREQIKEFVEQTGYSRRTFFRLKSYLESSIVSKCQTGNVSTKN